MAGFVFVSASETISSSLKIFIFKLIRWPGTQFYMPFFRGYEVVHG